METKVYQFNDYEWIATNWSLEKTIEWYENNYAEITDDERADIRECNLDTEGMWWVTTNPEDIRLLGTANSFKSNECFGSIMRQDGDILKRVSFREAIRLSGDFDKPFILASTEW